MDDAGATLAADALEAWTVVQERVDKRPAVPPAGRVNRDSRRLADDQTIIIFKQNFPVTISHPVIKGIRISGK